MHCLLHELEESKVEDRTYYQNFNKLETGLVKQVIALCVILVAKLSVDMAHTNNNTSDLYCATLSGVIYC